MPKWALDPLLTESSPLQSGPRGDGHGAVNGGGAVDHEPDSEGDYDSEFSDEDMGRVRGATCFYTCSGKKCIGIT